MKHEQCPLPYHQLYFHSSGKVYPCGFLQNNILLGDLKKTSIKEIWNSPEMLRFRKLHQEGKNIFCSENQKKFSCHLLHTDMNKHEEQKNSLKRLDFMIDSFCNLKCKMCTNLFEETHDFTTESFWKELHDEILPDLDQIEVIGGEPFVLKNTFKLIDIGSRSNPDLKWWFTTNGHFEFNKSFTSHLDKIKIHSMAISIDSLKDDIFSKIRDGGNLKKVLETLDKFIEYKEIRNDFFLVINFLIQKDNAYELPELIRFSRKKGVKYYPILLRDPKGFSILDLPADELLKILDFYIEENLVLKDHKLMSIILKISKHIDKFQKMQRIEQINNLSHLLAANG